MTLNEFIVVLEKNADACIAGKKSGVLIDAEDVFHIAAVLQIAGGVLQELSSMKYGYQSNELSRKAMATIGWEVKETRPEQSMELDMSILDKK